MLKDTHKTPINSDSAGFETKNIFIGFGIFTIFCLIFVIWGIIAPIDSASIAEGKIVLNSNSKIIQHLEGGIIDEILVKEGQVIEVGQPIISLQDIQSKSQNEMLKKQLVSSMAIKERLLAQSKEGSIPDFGEIMSNDKGGTTKELIMVQNHIFETQKQMRKSKVDILNKRIDQVNYQIKGVESQRDATLREIKVLYRQKSMSKKLVRNNNHPLTKYLDIQKEIAVLEGKFGELNATIAKLRQSILENNLEIINISNEFLSDSLDELQEVEMKISDLTEQLNSSKDVLKRTIIRSPTAGIVTNLKYHTIGAVISPGADIVKIVPQDDELIIECKVAPNDIDNVKSGLEAKVSLTAYKSNKVPRLLGIVSSVSADIVLDENTKEQYFLARIKIHEGELEKLKENVILYPGMPAQVFIITGKRSLIRYIFDPIIESSYKAFREQ